jgi:hypothetical protein
MMPLPTFYLRFQDLENPQELTPFLRSLSANEWIEFLNLFCSGSFEYLTPILKAPKGEDVQSYGLVYLRALDSSTKDLVRNAQEHLLGSHSIPGNEKYLNSLLSTIRFLDLPVSTHLLIDIVQNTSLLPDVREHAGITLSAVHPASLDSFWDKLDLERDQFLIPTCIRFYERTNPLRGLQKLQFIPKRPINTAAFDSPVHYALLQLSVLKSEWQALIDLMDRLPVWASDMIMNVLSHTDQLILLKTAIERRPSVLDVGPKKGLSLQIVKMAIPEDFPDILILVVLDNLGFFRKYGLDVRFVHPPWGEVFDEFLRNDVHVIVGNELVMDSLNNSIPTDPRLPRFKKWFRIDDVNGGALMASPRLKLGDHGSGVNINVRELLLDLRGRQIVAAPGTDFKEMFLEQLHEHGIPDSEYDFIPTSPDPNTGFIEFIHGRGDVLVGSEVHAEKATERGFQTLLSAKGTKNVQRNWFITREFMTGADEQTGDIISRLILIMNRGIESFESHKMEYSAMLHQEYNTRIRRKYGHNYDLLSMTQAAFMSLIDQVIAFKRTRTQILPEEAGGDVSSKADSMVIAHWDEGKMRKTRTR